MLTQSYTVKRHQYIYTNIVKGESNRRKPQLSENAEPHPIFYKYTKNKNQYRELVHKDRRGDAISDTGIL